MSNFLHFLIRSPGEIIGMEDPKFAALDQVGVAKITTRNTGQL
jgi:hypothetical protein